MYYEEVNFTRIFLLGIIPSANVVICMCIFSNGWVAMYSMHVFCMILIPTILYGSRFLSRAASFLFEVNKHLKVLNLAYIVFLTSSLGVLATNVIFKLLINHKYFGETIKVIRDGLVNQGIVESDKTRINGFSVTSLIYFCVANPVIEEFFWRFFIANELIQIGNEDESNVQIEQSKYYSTDIASIDQKSESIDLEKETCEMKYQDKESKEFGRIISSLLYSSYHFFVISSISTNTLALFGVFSLIIVGRFLLHVYEKYNIVYSIYIHIGLDIYIAVSLLLILVVK